MTPTLTYEKLKLAQELLGADEGPAVYKLPDEAWPYILGAMTDEELEAFVNSPEVTQTLPKPGKIPPKAP